MERHARRRRWSQWNGTIDSFGEVAAAAVRVLDEKTGEKFEARVEVVRGERTWQTDKASGLGGLAEADLDDIHSLKLDIVPKGDVYVDPWDEWGKTLSWQVFVRAQRASPALTLEVSGPDETILEGLFQQLSELLKPRSSRPAWLTRQWVALLGAALVLLTAVLLDPIEFALGFPSSDGYLTLWEMVVEASLLGSMFVITAVAFWALPDLEVVALDEKPRFNRSIRLIASIVGVVVVEVIASVVAAAMAIS